MCETHLYHSLKNNKYPQDSKEDISWMVQKIIKMRIFEGKDGEQKALSYLIKKNYQIVETNLMKLLNRQ
ncbi:hypothetical protein N9K77_00715 [bacterium]|nr:hypothetical protein [bacterium]